MENIISLILYFVFFLISLFWIYVYQKGKYSKKYELTLQILFTLPIIILQGLRYDVGTDYQSYSELAQKFSENDQVYTNWFINEPIFLYMAKVCYMLFNSAVGYFFIDSILMNYLLIKLTTPWKHEISLVRFYFMFYLVCLPYFFNAERQGIAVIMVWIAFNCLNNNEYKNYFIWIIIAVLVHNTAIVGLVFFVYKIVEGFKRKFWKYVIIMCSLMIPFVFNTLAVFILGKGTVFGKYSKFMNNITAESTNLNLYYWLVFAGVLLFLFREIDEQSYTKSEILLFICLQLVSFILNRYINYGFRLSYYFQIGVMYSYSYVIKKMHSKIKRIIYDSFFAGLLLFHFIYKYYLQGNSEIFPYKFVFFR